MQTCMALGQLGGGQWLGHRSMSKLLAWISSGVYFTHPFSLVLHLPLTCTWPQFYQKSTCKLVVQMCPTGWNDDLPKRLLPWAIVMYIEYIAGEKIGLERPQELSAPCKQLHEHATALFSITQCGRDIL